MPFNKIKGTLFNNNNIISNSNIALKVKYDIDHTKIIPNYKTEKFNNLVSDIEIGFFKERNFKNKIFDKNIKINRYVYEKKWLNEIQFNNFKEYSYTIKNMVKHIVISEEQENKVLMAIQTTKNESFKYWDKKDNLLLISNVTKIKDGSFYSNLKYSINLTENFCLESIKNDDSLMNYYEYTDIELLQIKIDVFSKIEKIIDIDCLIKSKFIILPYIYDVVHQNYINKEISQEKWEKFLEYYNLKIKELNLEDLRKDNLGISEE